MLNRLIAAGIALALGAAVLTNVSVTFGLQEALAAIQLFLQDPTASTGHFDSVGPLPAISGGTITAGSSDRSGQFTATSAAAVTVTFARPYVTAPNCVVTDNTTVEALRALVNATTIIVLGHLSSDKVAYHCTGIAGD